MEKMPAPTMPPMPMETAAAKLTWLGELDEPDAARVVVLTGVLVICMQCAVLGSCEFRGRQQ
jgi:hypothetical protein